MWFTNCAIKFRYIFESLRENYLSKVNRWFFYALAIARSRAVSRLILYDMLHARSVNIFFLFSRYDALTGWKVSASKGTEIFNWMSIFQMVNLEGRIKYLKYFINPHIYIYVYYKHKRFLFWHLTFSSIMNGRKWSKCFVLNVEQIFADI